MVFSIFSNLGTDEKSAVPEKNKEVASNSNSSLKSCALNPDLPCLIKGTSILTPTGYIEIENIKEWDIIVTDDKREVPILEINSFIVKGKKNTYPYIIPKNSISNNYPPNDLLLFGNNLIKYKDKFIDPRKDNKFKKDESMKIIKYYHVILPSKDEDHLVINNGAVIKQINENYNNSNLSNDEKPANNKKKSIKNKTSSEDIPSKEIKQSKVIKPIVEVKPSSESVIKKENNDDSSLFIPQFVSTASLLYVFNKMLEKKKPKYKYYN